MGLASQMSPEMRELLTVLAKINDNLEMILGVLRDLNSKTYDKYDPRPKDDAGT
jgi:hypothetical protein